AAVAQGWRELVGDAGRCVSLEHFGASADYQRLYTEFGTTAEAGVPAAKASRADVAAGTATPGGPAKDTRGGTGDLRRPTVPRPLATAAGAPTVRSTGMTDHRTTPVGGARPRG